ncbi:dystroglycan-like isoform X2 [Sceloporus undulatus]|nr:dystroglycan-like isoform X2 [Sceloporus undulatus]
MCEEIQILQGVQDATAVIGRIFSYPISPFAFQGKITHYEVTLANGSTLPKWLEYNPKTKTLQGLPLLEESGEYPLAIFAYGDTCIQKTPTASTKFALHVQDSILAHDKTADPNQKHNSVCSGALCVRDISVTFAEIIIHAPGSLEAQERLYLICTMAEYLRLDPSTLTLTPFSNHFRNLTVLAEDIRYVNTTRQYYVGLYWPVGFGVFAMLYELVQVLQHNVESNSLSQLLGYEISGWRVLKKEGHEKKHSEKQHRRHLMATPRPALRPTTVEAFTPLSATLPQSVRPVKSLSLLYEEAIPTKTDTFLHSVINQKDLQTTNVQVLPKTPASPIFQDVPSELLPSLMSTSIEFKVVYKTPPISELLQTQVPQDMYSTLMKSEPNCNSTQCDLIFSVPFTKTQLSSSLHSILDASISTQVTPSGKGLSLEHISRETTDLDYRDLYRQQTTSHFLSEDTVFKVKFPLPSVPSLVDLRASSGFPCPSTVMSLFLSDGSYDNQGLLTNYKYARVSFLSSPLITMQTEVPSWNTGFSLFGITSVFETTVVSTASALKLDPSPTAQVYYSGKIQTLAMYSSQEFNTSQFANFLEFGLLSRTSSLLAMFTSLTLAPPMELTVSFGLSNIFPTEALLSNGRQGRTEVTGIYEHAPESFMMASQTKTQLIAKYKMSAITSVHMDTPLQKQQPHFFYVTGSNSTHLSSKFLGKEEAFWGMKQISEWHSYKTSVLAWPTEFASTPILDLSVNEYGFYNGSVVRTLVVHPETLQLDMSTLCLESSFGTKGNVQMTRESLTKPVEESTVLSNKEIHAQTGFYISTLYQGAQDTVTSMLTSERSPQGIGATWTPLFSVSQIMPIGQTNNSPRIVNAIKWITATIGYKFSFSVPHNTFYDQEDGNTTQLTLGLKPADGSPTGRESWLQFNSSCQTMYGYPLENDFQYSPQEFLLFATDSGGLRTSDTLIIEMLRPPTNPCHSYTLRTKNSYHSFLRNREKVNLFFEKLSNYLIVGNPGNMVLLHLKPGSTAITWYSKSFCTMTTGCARDEIQDVLTKLGAPSRNVNSNFVEAMLPDYKIYQIEDVKYRGICLSPAKLLNESLMSNRTLTMFKDDCSWIGNVFSVLLIGISTTVIVILIVTLHFCKYQKRTVVGSQSSSVNERPFFTYIDLEMDMLRSRKSPVLEQEVTPSAKLWLSVPAPSQQHVCRANTTLAASGLPPPPKYRLPPSYVTEGPSQNHHDHSHRKYYPKARLY